MASMIRSRRIALAAGALSVALVAPLTPAAPNAILPAAVAQAVNDPTPGDFKGQFTTTWDEERGVAIIEGITLPDDIVIRPNYKDGLTGTKSENRWGISNENGNVVLTPAPNVGKSGDSEGTYGMPIRVILPQGTGRTDNPKVQDLVNGVKAAEAFNITDSEFRFSVDRTPAWVGQITGLDVRHDVDFSENATQTLENVQIPQNAETYTITNGWTTRNDSGRLQITPPSTYNGGDADIQLKVRVPDNNDPQKSWSETITVKINGTKPANNLLDQLGGLLGGGGGDAAGGVLGAALPLLLGALGLGGGGGAGAGFLPGLNSVISITIPDAKIEIHGNSVNDSGNPIVEVKDNKATADIRDNVRDNPVMAEAPVNVNANDNGKVLENFEGFGGSSSKESKTTKVSAGGSKKATVSNDRVKRPECIASIVGFGLPAAALIPVLLANVFRIPGFEGIQDSMKAAAASMPGQLNVSPEQVAAGVGGFAGALAIAGLAGVLTQCLPASDEKSTAATATATETVTVPAN